MCFCVEFGIVTEFCKLSGCFAFVCFINCFIPHRMDSLQALAQPHEAKGGYLTECGKVKLNAAAVPALHAMLKMVGLN